jgi:hypothetical protein
MANRWVRPVDAREKSGTQQAHGTRAAMPNLEVVDLPVLETASITWTIRTATHQPTRTATHQQNPGRTGDRCGWLAALHREQVRVT